MHRTWCESDGSDGGEESLPAEAAAGGEAAPTVASTCVHA